LATLISDKLGIPVIDGVSTAVKFIEALVGLRLSTSKTGDLAYPIAKTHWGILSTFTPARSSK
jgi:allantoin racemase